MNLCPCGSGRSYEECCEPIINGTKFAETPEALTRARYTACSLKNFDFLEKTTLPKMRDGEDLTAAMKQVEFVMFDGLKIVSATGTDPNADKGEVVFQAGFSINGQPQLMFERSYFEKADGQWWYVDGDDLHHETSRRTTPKVGRNDPCPCGSGKKYKKCCGKNLA